MLPELFLDVDAEKLHADRHENVAEREKAPFLRRPCDHDRVTQVQLPPTSRTLLRLWQRLLQ